MHKSSKTRWSDWSAWIWNDQYQRYYRQRQDTNGQIDTQWDEPRGSEYLTDELSQNLQNTHIHDTNPQSPSSVTSDEPQNEEYTFSSSSSRHKPKSSSSKGKSKSSKSSSSKSKGKSPAVRDDGGGADRETTHASSSLHTIPDDPYYTEAHSTYDYSQPPGHAYGSGATATYPDSTSASRPADPYNPADYTQDEEQRIADAIAESRNYNYGAHTAGESSSTTYSPAYEFEDEGPPTPRAGKSHSHIAATGGDEEELDPRYRVEPSHRFQPGEVFKVLWCEPQGGATDGTPSVSERFEVRDRFGGRIFVGFRRFIVIANDQGHCTCVPILTYGGKACNKKGAKPEKHGIVYEKGHKSKLLPGEPKLGFAPVKIQMTEDGEKLSKESRVNYSKLVTVEHNVKVLFIGRIAAADWDVVSEAVNRCWEEKIHHKRKHFDR